MSKEKIKRDNFSQNKIKAFHGFKAAVIVSGLVFSLFLSNKDIALLVS